MKNWLKTPNIKEIERLEKEENHFARGLNGYKLFWIFFIGSFLGVIIETIWCLVTRFHYENRVGLVFGPLNFVYGFGALAMAVVLYKFKNQRDLTILLGGLVIGTVVEYICSLVQELMFGSISWDYANFPFNIQGRVNVLYSIFWGILAIVWLKFVYPLITSWILKIPNRIGKSLTFLLLMFLIIDTIITCAAVDRWTRRRDETATSSVVWNYFDKCFPDERMEKIYPNMVFR